MFQRAKTIFKTKLFGVFITTKEDIMTLDIRAMIYIHG